MTPCNERCNLANNNGGGEQNRPWVLGTLRSSHVRKRGKTGLNQSLIHLHPIPTFPPPRSSQFFLFAPLQFRSQEKKFFGKKNIEWHLLPLALPTMRTQASSYVRFGVFTAMNKNSYQLRYDTVYFDMSYQTL